MGRTGQEPPWGLACMVPRTQEKENAPREQQLPLRQLRNQSMLGYQKTEEKSMGEREMMVDVVAISTKEYKKMAEAQVRIDIFSDFVNKESYSISRADCARYLGFGLEEEEKE